MLFRAVLVEVWLRQWVVVEVAIVVWSLEPVSALSPLVAPLVWQVLVEVVRLVDCASLGWMALEGFVGLLLVIDVALEVSLLDLVLLRAVEVAFVGFVVGVPLLSALWLAPAV